MFFMKLQSLLQASDKSNKTEAFRTLAISCDTIKEMTDLSTVQTGQMTQNDVSLLCNMYLLCISPT